MNKLDRVFNEKLADHSVAPAAAAWDRIEAGLSKKNSPMLWLRWAAILIPGTILGFLWISQPIPSPSQIAKVTTSPAPTAISTPNIAETQSVATQKATPIKKKKSRRKEYVPQVIQPTTLPQEKTVSLPESVTPLEDVTLEPAADETVPVTIVETKPMVLVYTLEPVVARPMPQVEAKKTPLGRVAEFANTVKHSDPLGDLRVMKDEFLAIDLRKKSTKKELTP